MSETKTCSKCGREKPLSEFYPRSEGSTSYLPECRMCMRERSRNQVHKPRTASGVESEAWLIEKLASLGIPALPGKSLAHQYADVIAWGCVLIESKFCNFGHQYHWTFSPLQQKSGIRGHLIVLGYEDQGVHYHLFDACHPAFYRKDGTLKTGVAYTPDRSTSGRDSAFTPDIMAEARDRWSLVEEKRRLIVEQLAAGTYAQLLRTQATPQLALL